MGGAWIHGTADNPLTDLCQGAGLALFATGDDILFLDQDGR
ncbi:unnamed protein product [Discosporangium mesarthrocarpum]